MVELGWKLIVREHVYLSFLSDTFGCVKAITFWIL